MMKYMKMMLWGLENTKKHDCSRWQQLAISFVKVWQLHHCITILLTLVNKKFPILDMAKSSWKTEECFKPVVCIDLFYRELRNKNTVIVGFLACTSLSFVLRALTKMSYKSLELHSSAF